MQLRRKVSDIFSKDWAVFLFLFGVISSLYANTLNVPFYFDDTRQIVNQAFTYDLIEASKLFFRPRGIVNISFALNFHFFGMNMPAFHVVNILFHFMTTFLVFLVLKRIFHDSRYACIFGALIFLVHPLQTQTVNYVVQRMTGMSGFFLFLSLYLFVIARETFYARGAKTVRHIVLYCAFAVAAGLAVLAKQNAATLPVLFLLFDSMFLNHRGSHSFLQRVLYIAPLIVVPAVLGFIVVINPMLAGKTLSQLGSFENLVATDDALKTYSVSSLRYFVTELSVFWLYFKLLIFPLNQALDYGYPLAAELLTFKSIAAGTGLALIFIISFYYKAKFPYLLFALLWFFLSLVVESTFIPLDPIYEHRLYVPLFGFAVLIASLIKQLEHVQPKNFIILACSILIVLSGLTIHRNSVWAEPIKFYETEVANSYGNYRPRISLAGALYENGEIARAREEYDKVIEQIEKASIRNIQPKMLVSLAIAYGRYNDYLKAEDLLRLALTRSPTEASIYYNLGIALYLQSKLDEAFVAFSSARKYNPGNPDSYYYVILLSAKLGKEANIPVMLKDMESINQEYASRLKYELGY